jgi:ABC-type microcin C transport system duplicated ATPase subunit YejF
METTLNLRVRARERTVCEPIQYSLRGGETLAEVGEKKEGKRVGREREG